MSLAEVLLSSMHSRPAFDVCVRYNLLETEDAQAELRKTVGKSLTTALTFFSKLLGGSVTEADCVYSRHATKAGEVLRVVIDRVGGSRVRLDQTARDMLREELAPAALSQGAHPWSKAMDICVQRGDVSAAPFFEPNALVTLVLSVGVLNPHEYFEPVSQTDVSAYLRGDTDALPAGRSDFTLDIMRDYALTSVHEDAVTATVTRAPIHGLRLPRPAASAALRAWWQRCHSSRCRSRRAATRSSRQRR
jgi:hypothetical protein